MWETFDAYQYWIVDSTLTVTCDQELTNESTAKAAVKKVESAQELLTIVGSVCASLAFLFLIGILVFCVRKMWKSRLPSRQSNQENVDAHPHGGLTQLIACFLDARTTNTVNPDYGVYGEVYEETEIYKRNAHYASSDPDMEDTVTTVIRDNNPEYE